MSALRYFVPLLIAMTAGDRQRIFDENPTIRTVFYDRIFEKTRCGETKIVLVGVEEREEGAKNRRLSITKCHNAKS